MTQFVAIVVQLSGSEPLDDPPLDDPPLDDPPLDDPPLDDPPLDDPPLDDPPPLDEEDPPLDDEPVLPDEPPDDDDVVLTFSPVSPDSSFGEVGVVSLPVSEGGDDVVVAQATAPAEAKAIAKRSGVRMSPV